MNPIAFYLGISAIIALMFLIHRYRDQQNARRELSAFLKYSKGRR